MNRRFFRAAAGLALAASASMVASPALARDRWGGWGWGSSGWGRHHDGVDAGDVLAGVLVIGGIAAIASAASKASRDRRDYPRYPDNRDYRGDYPNSDYRSGEYGRDDYRTSNGDDDSRAMNEAVNRCVDEVERGSARIDQVDEVERDGDGWRVTGQVKGDDSFACSVDRDGRIRQVTVDGHAL